MKSLLIISSPRSLSTQVYEICCASLPELKQVPNVTRGEVFNFYDNTECTIKHCDRTENGYKYVCNTLDQYYNGYIIKSVVQPFHISRYLDFNEGKYNVLYIKRDRDTILTCQHLLNWQCVDPIFYEALYWQYNSVHYEELIYNTECLWILLRSMGYIVNDFNYINDEFVKYREQVLLKTGVISDYSI